MHFEFFQNGRYVDPLGRKFPSADPVPAQLMSQFQAEVGIQMASLPNWDGSAQVVKTGNISQTQQQVE